MMHIKPNLLYSIILSICALQLIGQTQSFEAGNPLEITPALSGNFGELRPNHFHAGIDLKTGGQENLPVRAVQDGFVSRIKISPYGYGKVIYVDHPEGYTTVYAHLNGFKDSIKRYVRKAQYAEESFSIDIYPGNQDLRVTKGQVIALSGNTGGSGGPHVHFEVRDTKSEIPRNPLLFNFPLGDTKRPVIQAIAIADQNSESPTQRFRVSGSSINYGKPIKATNQFGIEVSGYDSQDGSSNHNGIFKVELFVDGKLHSTFKADSIPFDVSRQLNALIDYQHYYRTHQRFIRLYRLPGNFLGALKTHNVTSISEGPHDLKVVASDVAGNKSTVSFSLIIKNGKKPTKLEADQINCSAHYFYESATTRFALAPHSLYKNVPLILNDSDTYAELLDPFTPINYPLEVQLKRPEKKGEVLARFTKDGRPIHALSTKRSGDWLIGESKSLGKFGVTTDTQAPSIKSLNVSNGKVFTSGQLQFQIADNFSGIASFQVSVNDQWKLGEYEPKKKLLWIEANEIPKSSESQQIKVEVIDMVGNVATFERTIYRK